MSVHSEYRYVLRVTTDSGDQQVELPLQPDWDAAVRCSQLLGIRCGALPARSEPPRTQILPVWDTATAAPHVAALEIRLAAPRDTTYTAQVPLRYLNADIRSALATLNQDGRFSAVTTIRYVVCAFVDKAWNQRAIGCSDDASLESVDEPLPVSSLALAPLLDRCRCIGSPQPGNTHHPVIIPAEVLRECTEQSRQAGDIEVGGVLIGKLVQDPHTSELGSVVSAQIPARHTRSDQRSLTFTAQTWADANCAIELRSRNEVILSWYHSHPDFCAKCPESRRSQCAYAQPFFSEADESVHKTAFPSAWSVALLLSWLGNPEPSCDMFGWHEGLIQPRAFHVASHGPIRFA